MSCPRCLKKFSFLSASPPRRDDGAYRVIGPNAAFSFLSGNGVDPTGRSRLAFARYQGQAEKALLAAGFPRVYTFRPAYIYPVEPRREPNLSYRLLPGIYPAFRVLFPNQVIRADDLGWISLSAKQGDREASF